MATRMKFPERKRKRQEEAKERNAKYAALSLDEKIERQVAYHLASSGEVGTPKQLRKLFALKEKAK